MKKIGNMEIYEDYVLLSINPSVYHIDLVYNAAYVLLEKAYVVLDGDPKSEIIVDIRPKNVGISPEELGNAFNSELINQAVYKQHAEKNAAIRQAMIQRALLTNGILPKNDKDSS